jgi:hypothetical protein
MTLQLAQVELLLYVVLFSQPFAQNYEGSGRIDANLTEPVTCYLVNTIITYVGQQDTQLLLWLNKYSTIIKVVYLVGLRT